MPQLSSADFSFVMIDLILVLTGLLMWAFWSLDQWRETKVKAFARADLFDMARRRNRR